MNELHVAVGGAARDAMCAAFDAARCSIDAELFSINEPQVVRSLNEAAARHVSVTLHVEGDPFRYDRKPDAVAQSGDQRDARAQESLRHMFSEDIRIVIEDHPGELWHGKAAVVDGESALISTANPTTSGFVSPGDVLVTDSSPRDVCAVEASIAGRPAACGEYVVTGPGAFVRDRIEDLLTSNADLRIASEDLSDRQVVCELVARKGAGHDDRILIAASSKQDGRCAQPRAVRELRRAGVEVRALRHAYMHEKYVDDGTRIYVGSANLTRNGLDEAHEVGVVAPSAAFGAGAETLRSNFDRNWSRAVPAT